MIIARTCYDMYEFMFFFGWGAATAHILPGKVAAAAAWDGSAKTSRQGAEENPDSQRKQPAMQRWQGPRALMCSLITLICTLIAVTMICTFIVHHCHGHCQMSSLITVTVT